MTILKKIYSFIQGWTRYYLYYGEYRNDRLIFKNKKLIEKIANDDFNVFELALAERLGCKMNWNKLVHSLLSNYIRQQIQIRIWSSVPCIEVGQCKICKCSTPALQMANKACEKPCYPAMLSKKDWEEFYGDGEHTPVKWYLDKSTNLEWTIFDKKFVHKEEYILNKFHKI
jgi:hypothetical protein